MNKIYDLHCHSNASDGLLSPTELVLRAAEKGVHVLALTDHDSIAGLAEARRQAQESSIKLINGVEISTQWENRAIHIVGLGFDENSEPMLQLLEQQGQVRLKRAQEIGEKLAKAGIPDAFEGAKKLAGGEVTRAHYARYLVQIGKVANEGQAFKRYLAQGKSCYVKAEWCDIPSAIEVIAQSGGLSILAHPLRYTMTNRQLKRLLADFKRWGGTAMEVSGCGQTAEQRLLLARWAQDFNLLASAGSDFHFPCAWIELGKSLTLPEGVIPVWHRAELGGEALQ
ncbi:hypothetical protein EDC45_0782 [Mesocricetibacter intestinalis]|uniref:Polymerase/histidinol phosphatase N-terminal domain-containing protein n=1 Tax=Mesocricetibacter intestinalis TaxID=1521930 RepID=A0A4R6VES7_9PAST|nr:PHP domain-containing protein [Mesocricetibacter intestinalis]TDQ58990.1 hypothetical protein EDC45_0782 [Mesocricetibacter intestinalis]